MRSNASFVAKRGDQRRRGEQQQRRLVACGDRVSARAHALRAARQLAQARCAVHRVPAAAARRTSAAAPRCADAIPARAADYRTLEVWDTSELRSLQELLTAERERVVDQRGVAKEQQRKVLRVDCDLDLKRMDKIGRWLETIYKDTRRTW